MVKIIQETAGYFTFELDGVVIAKNIRNDLFIRNDGGIFRCDFKTATGANILSKQRILISDVTVVTDMGVEYPPFATPNALFLALIEVGYFDWMGNFNSGGGSTGVNRFKDLLDTFGYVGNDGKVPTVNEAQNKLDPTVLFNISNFSELYDVSSIAIDASLQNKTLTVLPITNGTETIYKIAWVDFPTPNNIPQDGFITLGTQSLVDGEFTASVGYTWRISGGLFGNATEFQVTVPAEEDGSYRKDKIVVTQDGENPFQYIQGIPSGDENSALEPQTPPGTLQLTTIEIFGDTISNGGDNPIIGTDYITKISQSDVLINTSSSAITLNLDQNGKNRYRIQSTGSNAHILGISKIDSGIVIPNQDYPYNGKEILICNEKTNDLIVDAGTPTSSLYAFEKSLTIPPDGIATFKMYESEGLFKLKSTNFSIVGEYIPLSGTVEGSPITGKLKVIGGIGNIECDTDNLSSLDLSEGYSILNGKLVYIGNVNDNKNYISISDDDGIIIYDRVLQKGLVGEEEFDKQGDRKAFAQLSDVAPVMSDDISDAKIEGDFIYGILDQYTGEEITLSKITSIPTGNLVDNIIYFQLGSELFKRVFTQYNIQWFGAKGDGITDATQAIQACINSCYYAGGGTILTPTGIYIIAGSLVTSDNTGQNPNSQIYIPSGRDVSGGGTETAKSIKFIGSETPTMNASGFADDKIDQITTGCYWKSTLPFSSVSGTFPSVISTKGNNPTYNFNVIDIMFQDMWIRVHHDSTVGTYLTAFNMLDAAFSTFNRCRADIDVAGFNSVEHQNMCIGIAPTKSNGGTTVVATNCTSYGYYLGYTVGEHSYYENLNANFCNYAYDISKAGHSSLITKCLAQWNKVVLSFNKYDNGYPTAFNFISILELIVENVDLGKWYDSVLDIEDPTNGIQGNCFYTKTISGAGVFPTTLLTKNGGEKLNDKHINLPIAVMEKVSDQLKLVIKNKYASGAFAYASIDMYGGIGIDDSSFFQFGQQDDGTVFLNNTSNKPIDFYTNGTKRGSINADGTITFLSTVQLANATSSNQAAALGQIVANVNSSAVTLNLATTARTNYYQHTGTGATWQLPDATANVMNRIVCTHKGSGVLTIASTGSQIWESGSASPTYVASVGESVNLYSDGVNWIVL